MDAQVETDASEEEDSDDTDTEEDTYWSVCEYRDGQVRRYDCLTEIEARRKFDGITDVSKVLFNTSGIGVEFSSTDRYDVAQILMAYQSGETPDRNIVIDAVNSGKAPYVPPDRMRFTQWCLKFVMSATFSRGTVRYFGASPLRKTSLCFFDVRRYPAVRNHIALTIDDAPCRFATRSNSRMSDILTLLKRYDARSTFMTIGSFVSGHEEDLVMTLKEGHELANHGMLDRAYHEDTPQEFAEAVEDCNDRIRFLQKEAGVAEGVSWFRAPHGKYTREMESVLMEKNMTNTMCDTYASCPIVQDGEFIGSFLANHAAHGSIVLIHMPEVGHREWCFLGLQRLLEGLDARGFKIVTVSELDGLAQSHDSQAERQRAREERRQIHKIDKLEKAERKTATREEKFRSRQERRLKKQEEKVRKRLERWQAKQERRQVKAAKRIEKKRNGRKEEGAPSVLQVQLSSAEEPPSP